MITRKEVKHVAELARLGITEAEIGEFQKEFSSILKYVEKLDKVNISKTEPTSHPFKIENTVRNDETGKREGDEAKLLDMAPCAKEGYIKVKSVFGN